jgi:HSP20 family protein
VAGRDLQREIEELFADLWQLPRAVASRGGFRPQVDIHRSADGSELTIVVDLAGVDPRDVRVTAAAGVVTVAGHRRRPAVSGRLYERMEIDYGPFAREIPLRVEVDPARASAAYRSGLLTIRLPVAKRPPRRKSVAIEIRAAR